MREKTEMFSFRFPIELRKKIEERAAKEGRTLTNMIIYILRQAVEK